jgi:hypothetical protein
VYNPTLKAALYYKIHIISVKKSPAEKSAQPKTELDRHFLSLAESSMKAYGISTDRATSIALGKHPDFINRVRRGIQSAPPDAWETLRTKFPTTGEALEAAMKYIASVGTGQAVGINHGTMSQEIDHYEPKRREGTSYYEWNNLLLVSAETHEALKREMELLKGQLADKERIIKLLEQSLNK